MGRENQPFCLVIRNRKLEIPLLLKFTPTSIILYGICIFVFTWIILTLAVFNGVKSAILSIVKIYPNFHHSLWYLYLCIYMDYFNSSCI